MNGEIQAALERSLAYRGHAAGIVMLLRLSHPWATEIG